MRILLITAEYGDAGGGLSLACSCFFKMLTESLKHSVSVASSVSDSILTAHGGYNPTLSTDIANEYRLKTLISTYSSDNVNIVIAFGGSFNGYFASILAQSINVRFILMLRGTDVNLAKWNVQEQMFLKNAIAIAWKVTCLSEEMKQNVLQEITLKKSIIVVPNIIDFQVEDITFPNLPKKIIIGTAASHINEKKGIANILNMVGEFKKRSKTPIRLDVIGGIDNDLKENYQYLIANLGLKENIQLLDYKSRKEYHKITNTWDFYIQGSVCEGFGNSVSEAITNGRGIILSPTGYIAESFQDKYSCLVFNCWDPVVMAERLVSLINMPNKSQYYKQAYKELSSTLSKRKITQVWNLILTNNMQALVDCEKRSGNIFSVVFHEIDKTDYDHITTPKEVFNKFVQDLYNNGYGICSLKSYLAKCLEDRKRWIVCTFDDGYATLLQHALPILKQYGFSATVFINTNLIGKDNSWNWKDTKRRFHLDKEGLRTLFQEGWEIASHGNSHKNLLQLSERDITNELAESKQILEKLVGAVNAYAYPYGDSSPFIRKICGQYYNYAFSLQQGGTELTVDNMQIRRYSIDDIYKILGI